MRNFWSSEFENVSMTKKAYLSVCVPIMTYPVCLSEINKRERKLNKQQSNDFISVCARMYESKREWRIKKQALRCVYSLRLM